ncbi:MAG: hypothetical protein ACUVX1_14610 [Chloroflexota bacterium]
MRDPNRKRALLSLAGMAALVLLASIWAMGTGPSQAQQGTMHNCPQPGKWAISVWQGEETETAQALDTCGADAVDAAYYIHPFTQTWRVFFRGNPDISNLDTLDDLQAVVTLGNPAASPMPSAEPMPTPGPSPGRMVGCPMAGKWAMSVWNGPNGINVADAFATCIEVIAVAYWLDPQTQTWERYVRDRPELTTLSHLDNLQGVFAVGSTEAREYCGINIPGSYHGEVTIDGQTAPAGTVIKAFRGGIEFGSTTVAENGTYAVDVPSSAPVVPPCFESAGGPLTFTCDGAEAQEHPSWGSGPKPQNLTCVHMRNCPAAGKWSIAVYSGEGGSADDALALCAVPVEAAYWLDPATQVWSRYFRGRPGASSLTSLQKLQGVIALGSASESVAAAAAAAASSAEGQLANQMEGCPEPGKWAISVWNGEAGTPTGLALASCPSVTVALAYWLDPQTQKWKRYLDGRPDVTNLLELTEMQGLITLGGEAR